MDLIAFLIDFILHLDVHLSNIIAQYGILTYGILFAIIFCETGLVFAPFLPGDSLLFAAGTFAALGSLNIWFLFVLLAAASILGDTVNYWIGRAIGHKIVGWNTRFINKHHIERTQKFFEKHGGKTILLARFVPIVRTFAPFIAGLGQMKYTRFLTYNVVGGFLWIALFLFGGFFFGNLSFVRDHFTVVILAIVFLSLIPAVAEFWQTRKEAKEVTKGSDK
ncbi:MAG: DedA family protein [bacterium]|nr:DedA family protein [bacterium]